MTFAYDKYENLTGAQQDFSIGWSYIDPSEVKAKLDGTEITSFTLVGGGSILRFSPNPVGNVLEIYRETDISEPIVEYSDDTGWLSTDLNNSNLQTLQAVQEARDLADRSILREDTLDFQGVRGVNVGDPVDATDAANKQYVDGQVAGVPAAVAQAEAARDAAIVAQGNAETAATNAGTSETNAASSAAAASSSAADAASSAASIPTTEVESKSSAYTVVADDLGHLIRGTATFTLSLTAAATLGGGFYFYVRADGGAMTIDPNGSETIDGATTHVLADGESATIFCDGSAFYMVKGNNGGSLGGRRNKIIDGNFDFWFEGTSHSTVGYGSATMWVNDFGNSACTVSRQSFALGQTDVPGNPSYFLRAAVTTSSNASAYSIINHNMEGVETLAGKTATVTFWAKADAAKDICVEFSRYYGSGGSPSVYDDAIGPTTCSLTTSWQKFSHTVTIPSVSGKTLGTDGNDHVTLRFWLEAGSDWNTQSNSLGNQSGTFDIARVSLVEGDATQEADPHGPYFIGDELAAVNRYYIAPTVQAVFSGRVVSGNSYYTHVSHSSMRTVPTYTFFSAGTNGFATSVPSLSQGWPDGFRVGSNASATVDSGYYLFTFEADARL